MPACLVSSFSGIRPTLSRMVSTSNSISLESLGKMPANLPDCLDILPGTMPKILRRVCADAKVPVLTGGMIADKEDVMAALDAGCLLYTSRCV